MNRFFSGVRSIGEGRTYSSIDFYGKVIEVWYDRFNSVGLVKYLERLFNAKNPNSDKDIRRAFTRTQIHANFLHWSRCCHD